MSLRIGCFKGARCHIKRPSMCQCSALDTISNLGLWCRKKPMRVEKRGRLTQFRFIQQRRDLDMLAYQNAPGVVCPMTRCETSDIEITTL